MLFAAIKSAQKIFDIENTPVTLIVKPYKTFAKSTAKLCAIFSLMVFVSFNLVLALFFFAVYIMLLYLTVVFIDFCAKFGYKKVMLAIVFAVLYFLCYLAASGLRNFLADSWGGL